MTRVNIPVDLEWADDLAEMQAERDEWRSRAERAEAERDEYRLQRDLWREGYGDIEAQGGIAALRAQLDAARGGWRPVTEAPLNVPVYVYVGYSDPFVARRIGENLWQDLDGAEFRFTDHGRFLYRPLPPAPGDEEARP